MNWIENGMSYRVIFSKLGENSMCNDIVLMYIVY